MNHRTRVLNAINHRQPDTVPIDFGSAPDSGIVAEGYEKFKKYFKVGAESIYSDRPMRTVRIDGKILDTIVVKKIFIDNESLKSPLYQKLKNDLDKLVKGAVLIINNSK